MAADELEVMDLEGAIRTFTCFDNLSDVLGPDNASQIQTKWAAWYGSPRMFYKHPSGTKCRVMTADKAKEFIEVCCPVLVKEHRERAQSMRESVQREINRLQAGISLDNGKIARLLVKGDRWL